MKHLTTILFISLLFLSKVGFGQLFMQNFSSSGTVSSYVSATPNNTQFTNISASAGSAVSIIGGRLDFTRTTGGEGLFSRSTSFSTVPTTLMVQFNLEVINSAIPVSSGCLFKVGNGLNDLSTPLDANANIFARFGINFTGVAGQFEIRNIDAGSNSAIFTGQQTITFVMNQSVGSLTYSAPNGVSRMLNSGFYDVWVGTSIVQNAVAALTSSVALANFKFNFRPLSDNQSIRIDNLYINSLGGSLPSNTFSLGTNGDFQSITNAGGVFNVLNNLGGVATGGYTFQVATDLTAETGVNPLNQISGMSIGNQVKIVPASDGRIVSGTGNPLINFNGADFVSIDGGNGGTITGANRMMIRNTNATGATFQFINDATNHTITDCTVESNSTGTGGVFFFTTGTTTGNDNNSISKCIIRNRTDIATANPRLAINTTGSSATIQNDNITFDACEFINFFASIDATAHIARIWDNTTNFTLKNSSVYQTATYNTAGNVLTSLIRISGTNTNNITIDGNFFGGRAANCGGGAYIYSTSAVGGRFRWNPILSEMATGTTLTIQNNTFGNIQTDFYEATTAPPANQWIGISGTGRMFIRNNTFSNLQFSILNGNATPTTTPVQLITYFGDGLGEITSNTIGNIRFSFAPTPTTAITNGFLFDAIRIDPASAGLPISQNTINGVICDASIAINALRGINLVSAGINASCTLTRNTVSNMTHNGTSASITSELVGIKSTANSNINITENNINTLTSALQIPSTQTTVSVAGINVSSSNNYDISKNTIHSIRCVAAVGTGANACGILLDGGISGKVEKQVIYNIRNTSGGTTPAAAAIISRNLGSSMLIMNNMIGLGLNTDGTANTEDAIYIGLWNNFSDGDNLTFVYNSVAIAGSITNGTKNSYGFLRGNNAGGSITTPMRVINNLFYNQRQELGTGSMHFAIGNQGVCGGWGGCGINAPCPTTGTFLPNYNAFFSINTATIGEWLGASQDFANWKTVTLADDKSVALASGIIFTSIETGNLHISNNEFSLNALALPLYILPPAPNPLSILTDFDGDFRRGADIGADEVEHNITFTGATNNNWNSPANWSPNTVPTCADIAIIPPATSVQVYGGTTAQCYRLIVQSGGTLTLQNNTAILEQCWLKGTTNLGTPPAPLIAHEGDIQLYGTMNLNDGTLRVAGNIVHDGVFDKWTSTTQMNLDIPVGNVCTTDYINFHNATVNTSDIINYVDINFHNLSILNTGISTIFLNKNVTVGDAITKEGILNITDGSTLVINGNKLTIEGTLAERTGTITGSTTSKLHILGKGDLVGTLKFTSASIEDFQEVVMNRINDGTVKGLAVLGNASLQINDFLDLTTGILKTGVVDPCASGGAASLEVSVTNPDLTNSIRNFNTAGYVNTGGWVWGNLRRAITGTGLYRFPLGDGSRYELFDINITNALTGTNNILGYFNQCDAPISGAWTVTDIRGVVHFVYSNICVGGYWRMSPDAFAGGRYDAEVFPVSIPCAYPDQTIGKSVEGAGVYGFGGSTHASGTKRTGYTSFSDFALITASVVLPVNLLSFNAFAQKNSALISWETVWERENDYFEVQKSIDGKNFFTIGRLSGKGTSANKNSYQFIDNEPHQGVNYYQLKQVDLDGKTNFSKVISLYFESNEEVFEIFPNPTTSLDINIILSAQAGNLLNISLIDALGRNISTENYTYKSQFIQLKSHEKLTKGIYFVVVHNISTGKMNTKKLIIE